MINFSVFYVFSITFCNRFCNRHKSSVITGNRYLVTCNRYLVTCNFCSRVYISDTLWCMGYEY